MPLDTVTNIGEEVSSMTAEGVTSALGTVWTIVGDTVTFIGENPVLMVCFVGGLVSTVGVRLFRRLKRAVGA